MNDHKKYMPINKHTLTRGYKQEHLIKLKDGNIAEINKIFDDYLTPFAAYVMDKVTDNNRKLTNALTTERNRHKVNLDGPCPLIGHSKMHLQK